MHTFIFYIIKEISRHYSEFNIEPRFTLGVFIICILKKKENQRLMESRISSQNPHKKGKVSYLSNQSWLISGKK